MVACTALKDFTSSCRKWSAVAPMSLEISCKADTAPKPFCVSASNCPKETASPRHAFGAPFNLPWEPARMLNC
eukprot:7777381-Alexandrium_andersonii.AAC.1